MTAAQDRDNDRAAPAMTPKRLTVGILAHVDAGKTTLTEGMLYLSGRLRRLGRVDHRDTFLDTHPMERERGITIFSKQARLYLREETSALHGGGEEIPPCDVVLLDTPGHTDFAAEAERTLSVLDYAILVVSATDGVQNHTLTLWQLLKTYGVPTFLFVNKMDQPHAGAQGICEELQRRLDPGIFGLFPEEAPEEREERLAMSAESLMEDYLENGRVDTDAVRSMIADRRLFPCRFGSALKLEGVRELLTDLCTLTLEPSYPERFAAKVYKIARDASGARLTYLKVTGGRLSVRDEIRCRDASGQMLVEKAAQLRLYTGEKYEQADTAEAGEIVAVVGLSGTFAGQGLGDEPDAARPVLEPVLTYRLRLPAGCDVRQYYPRLKQLEEEDPTLRLVWQEELKEIHAQLMGEVQIEILERMIRERFGIEAVVDEGRILYKETVAAPVEGVGHFEPLRHYAEVHLAITPLPEGSGVVFDDICPDNVLEKNWRRLILAGLGSRVHRGVLIGAPLTDVRITLLCGRASLKHTDGGDFREAACRAVRQGLMKAEPVLLEPYYRYRLEVPAVNVGRAMTDMTGFFATVEVSAAQADETGTTCLSGRVPVSELKDYAREVAAYTRGMGRLFCTFDGYAPCHDRMAVLAAHPYVPEADLENTPHSVFCAHGAGFVVPWNEVARYMHMDSGWDKSRSLQAGPTLTAEARASAILPSAHVVRKAYNLSDSEFASIMARTFGPEKRRTYKEPKKNGAEPVKVKKTRPAVQGPRRMVIDGYNLMFQWDKLSALAEQDLEYARETLMDLISNYVAFTKVELTLVFDAYRVRPNLGKTIPHDGYTVVYTAANETADAYIERLVHKLGPDYRLRVVTSDGLVQVSALHAGVSRMSAREFIAELTRVSEEITAYIRKMSEKE